MSILKLEKVEQTTLSFLSALGVGPDYTVKLKGQQRLDSRFCYYLKKQGCTPLLENKKQGTVFAFADLAGNLAGFVRANLASDTPAPWDKFKPGTVDSADLAKAKKEIQLTEAQNSIFSSFLSSSGL